MNGKFSISYLSLRIQCFLHKALCSSLSIFIVNADRKIYCTQDKRSNGTSNTMLLADEELTNKCVWPHIIIIIKRPQRMSSDGTGNRKKEEKKTRLDCNKNRYITRYPRLAHQFFPFWENVIAGQVV